MSIAIKRVEIARNDRVYESFPDVCLLSSGRMICAYREADTHIASTSRLMLTLSDDKGVTWSQARQLDSRSSFAEDSAVWHDPLVSQLNDGRIVIVCTKQIFPDEAESQLFPESKSFYQTFLWFSNDEGENWTSPHLTEIEGLSSGRVIELRENYWVLAIRRASVRFPGFMRVQIAFSFDQGCSWFLSAMVAEENGFRHDEPSIVHLGNGRLICVMREDTLTKRPSHCAISENEGLTWSKPFPSPFHGHRPMVGILQSGLLLVTYRNVEPALDEEKLKVGKNPGTSAWLGDINAIQGDGEASGFLDIENDSSGWFGDFGYTGWVQFEDGEIFCVYHHRDDSSMSYIKGAWFKETDFS